MCKSFSKNLKYLRKLKKVSQLDLAEKLKVDRSTISKWETGDIDPTVGNVIGVANFFNIDIASLINRDLIDDKIDEIDNLYNNNKHLLTDEDKDMIKFIIEKRIK